MKSRVMKAEKIPEHYVSSGYIQDMIAYREHLTMFGSDGIIYCDEGNSIIINKYLEDERRKEFPYSNIPIHCKKVGFQKLKYTNQILDFEKPYLAISSDIIVEKYVLKDEEQALLITSILSEDKYTKYMNYNELLRYIGKRNEDEKVYYINANTLSASKNLSFNEEKIYEYIKHKYIDLSKVLRRFSSSEIAFYDRNNPWFLNYIDQCSKNLDYSLIDFNIEIDDKYLIVRVNNGEISIQSIEVVFVKKDEYKVLICNIPVNRYTLEQVKYVSKITTLKEPKIPLRLNPYVTKEDIEEARQMVKALNSIQK